MQLIIDGNEAIGSSEQNGRDQQRPPELGSGESPASAESAVQQGLIQPAEEKFFSKTRHYQQVSPPVSLTREPRMKTTTGAAAAIMMATIPGLNQPGVTLDVTPIDPKETAGVNHTTSNVQAVVRTAACQLQCRCWNPFTRGSPATALKRMTKDPTNQTNAHRRMLERQSATNTNGKVHNSVSPALRPTLTRYVRSGMSNYSKLATQ